MENNILSACYERLEYIENSNLKPEEITYYVLFGVSLGTYISREAAKENISLNDESKKNEVD